MSRRPDPATSCQHHSKDGKRCHMLLAADSPTLCTFHARSHAKRVDLQRDDSEDLSGLFSQDLPKQKSAADIHTHLWNLSLALQQGRISPRRAAVLAYINSLLLRTLPVIEKQDSSGDSAGIDMTGAPRPIRNLPPPPPAPADNFVLPTAQSTAPPSTLDDPPPFGYGSSLPRRSVVLRGRLARYRPNHHANSSQNAPATRHKITHPRHRHHGRSQKRYRFSAERISAHPYQTRQFTCPALNYVAGNPKFLSRKNFRISRGYLAMKRAAGLASPRSASAVCRWSSALAAGRKSWAPLSSAFSSLCLVRRDSP